MPLAMTHGTSSAGSSQDFQRFEVLFEDDLDELRALARDHGVNLNRVADAYFVIVGGDTRYVSHRRLQDELDVTGPEATTIASVLMEFGEVHRSRKDQWWWIAASERLATACQRRQISLKQYIDMEADLRAFQEDVLHWYETRQMTGNLQTKTMREIKVEHGRRLQEEFYPETPLDPEHFHDHQISRYLKTAQDVIVEARNLSY